MFITDLFPLVRLMARLREVERVEYAPGAVRCENTAEHSYALALSAWHLITAHNLPLDAGRCMAIALTHDLVEVYAGDTYIFADAATLATKDAREADALARIAAEVPAVPELPGLMHEYKERMTPEARFVYALDKILPMVNGYLDDGRLFREMNLTLRMLIDHKTDRIAVSPEARPYYDEMLGLLREREEEMFAAVSAINPDLEPLSNGSIKE